MTLSNPNKSFFEYSENILVLFFFIGLIIIGYILHQDYGISLDEEISRNNGLVSIKYICDFLLPQYTCNFESIKNVPNLKDYSDRQYGVFFEILLIAITEIKKPIQ